MRWLPGTLQATKTGEIPDWYPNAPQEALYVRLPIRLSHRTFRWPSTRPRPVPGPSRENPETKVNALQKRFEEETGTAEEATLLQQFTQATKLVVSTNMNGSRMKDQRTVRDGNNWRAYVLMELPIGAANAQLMDEIKKNKELYTRFRASEVYKELDTEVQKYEEWKKAQKE
jgi:hypothetical protein